MHEYADLEIGIHRRDSAHYSIDLRFFHPYRDGDIRLIPGNSPLLARFDLEQLRSLKLNPEAYGQLLTDAVFADPPMRSAFEKAFAAAQELDKPLRVRLFIGPSAPDLHFLLWETLRNPQDNSNSMLTSEHILFSRYLSSFDWRPIRIRPRTDMRALVVIADPANVGTYAPSGAPFVRPDVEGETQRIKESLGERIAVTVLASNGAASLNNIARHLRDGYDILYLVGHGALIEYVPHIWLENEQGNAEVTPGDSLLNRIQELRERPRLIVLASCQSASSGNDPGHSDRDTLAALGPRLAEAGIPAVLAMQGNITMQTVAEFMPVFFQELQRDGQIDRAIAVARGAVRDRIDWWMPVLFMRLKSGRIWYVPGFGDERKDFQKWPALLRNIKDGNCTPILGTNIGDILGSRIEIAQSWSETFQFPLEPFRQENLPQVAQYLATSQDPQFPRTELLEHLKNELLARYNNIMGESADLDNPDLETLFATVGRLLRERNEFDPYRVLAELPFRVYITTNFSNLLFEALKAAGRDPQVEICRWNKDIESIPSIYDSEPDYQPDVQRPLIYHLFGYLQEVDSLVVTEDDYFDYLIGTSKNKDLIPPVVREVLADTGLLFLGFRPDDWDFRILFRSMMDQGGSRRRKRYAHVLAQIEPEEDRIMEPTRARQYLEAYFLNANIDVFWGNVQDFASELIRAWRSSMVKRGK